MKVLLPLLFALALSTPSLARAKGSHSPSDAASNNGSDGKSTALNETCNDRLNSQDPLAKANKPPAPLDGASQENPISDADAAAYKFTLCEKVRRPGTSDNDQCDATLAKIYQFYVNDTLALNTLRNEIKARSEEKAKSCVTGQAASQNCMGEIYNTAATRFNQESEKYAKQFQELSQKRAAFLNAAKATLGNPAQSTRNAQRKSSVTPYMTEAGAGQLQNISKQGEIGVCLSKTGNFNTPYCGQAFTAGYASYYAKIYGAAKNYADGIAQCYSKNAQSAQSRASGTGPAATDSSISGKPGMGLDDLMKLATLGMTGGTLYCSVTKSCSPSKASDSSLNTDTSTSGATAPTPNATNGPASSSLGDNKSGASSSPLGSATATDTSSSLGHAGGSGSSSGYDSALQHFNGTLDSRAPASSSPATTGASGGGSFAGIGGNGSPGPTKGDANIDPVKVPDTGGMGNAFGGLPNIGASGGFSLDSRATAPADSALKNILNGDLPTSTDTSLLPLGDNSTGAQAATDVPEDPESLFMRARATYVRCLKRGCVGQGVGENI